MRNKVRSKVQYSVSVNLLMCKIFHPLWKTTRGTPKDQTRDELIKTR